MIGAIRKKYADKILKPYLKWYLKKTRVYTYGNLKLKIYPGVFHPHYFFSTLFFISFSEELDLDNRAFCEVGAGSGLASFTALSAGAKVTCIELNSTAVQGLNENIHVNSLPKDKIKIIESNLFDLVPKQGFDVMFINPPYFFKDASGESSLAWNCGSNGQYFEKLFLQLPDFVKAESEVYMTLAENCDILRIRQIAEKHGHLMICVKEKKIKWEKNFIFKIVRR